MPQTRHQIGARELGLMKKSAFLINTARGAIVDEAALVRALKGKKIAGAGLDVFEHEPKVHPELKRMKNVVIVPHLGSATVEVREEMANIVVDNIMAVLEGQPAAEHRQSGGAGAMTRPIIAVTDSPFPSLDPVKAALACQARSRHPHVEEHLGGGHHCGRARRRCGDRLLRADHRRRRRPGSTAAR